MLEPANPNDRAIEVSASDDFAVLGVVSGVFRPFFEKEIVRELDEQPVAPARPQVH